VSRPAILIAAIMLTVLSSAAILVALAWRYGGQSDSGGDAPGPPSVRPAQAFTVLYRVEDSAGPLPRTETDYLAVRRPFDVRLEHRDGPPPGGVVLAGTIVTRQSEITLGGPGDGFTRPHAPQLSPEVVSEPALRTAARAGVAEQLGGSSVLGQRCTRFAYRALGSEPLALPNAEVRVQACVTDDDILLREVIELGGRAVRVSQAVLLDRSPSFGPSAFATAHPSAPAPDALGDQVTEGSPQGMATPIHALLPPGFRPERQASVARSLGPDTPPALYYAQRFVSAQEEIVVEQPLITEEGSPWTDRGGQKLDLHNGEPASILYHPGYVEVQTRRGGVPARVMASRRDIAVYVARWLRLSR
jgi:hypothetical protein